MKATTCEEFRGCENLVFAEVTTDTKETYATGEVMELAPVAEISKTVESSGDTKYYDNTAMIIVNSEGKDTVTLTVPALDLKKLATITGKRYDDDTGAYSDEEPKTRYFAIGYKLQLTDGTSRYVWRLKGNFSVPDEKSATINGGTDTSNQQVTYTGISTIHKFTKTGKSAKALVADERDDKSNLSTFFDAVTTIDTLKAKVAEG